ncbi:MAG: DUF4129 domain-containing protein [Thermoprotei archaeon]
MSPVFEGRALATLLLVFLLFSLNQLLAVAEDISRIHTPDFPERLSEVLNEGTNPINYSEYFQLIKEFFDLANNNVSFDELLRNPSLSGDLDKLVNLVSKKGDLENAHRIKVLRDYSFLNPQELLQNISSDELRSLLQKVVENGFLNEEILKEISEMYLSGNISFDDYVKALYFLKKTSSDSDLVVKIDSLLMNALLNSLANSSLNVLSGASTDTQILENNVTSEALKSMLSFFSKEVSADEGLVNMLKGFLERTNTQLPSLPEVRFPQFSIGLPAPVIPFNVGPLTTLPLLTAILLGVLTYMLVKRERFAVVLTRLPLIRDRYLGGPDLRSEVIRAYWGSVELLKKRIPRSLNETHREYLDKVLMSAPSLSESFKYLTEAYERVRWGAQEEKVFINGVRKAYEDLVRELSKA